MYALHGVLWASYLCVGIDFECFGPGTDSSNLSGYLYYVWAEMGGGGDVSTFIFCPSIFVSCASCFCAYFWDVGHGPCLALRPCGEGAALHICVDRSLQPAESGTYLYASCLHQRAFRDCALRSGKPLQPRGSVWLLLRIRLRIQLQDSVWSSTHCWHGQLARLCVAPPLTQKTE